MPFGDKSLFADVSRDRVAGGLWTIRKTIGAGALRSFFDLCGLDTYLPESTPVLNAPTALMHCGLHVLIQPSQSLKLWNSGSRFLAHAGLGRQGRFSVLNRSTPRLFVYEVGISQQ